MNRHNTLNTLATSSLIIALAFVAQACCGIDKEDADQVLRIDIKEGRINDADTIEPKGPEKLCGAEVIARGDDGSELVMEEVETENGCEYVAEGDSDVTYTVSASHPELGGSEDLGDTNPACSTPTASEDVDNTLFIVKPELSRDFAPQKG